MKTNNATFSLPQSFLLNDLIDEGKKIWWTAILLIIVFAVAGRSLGPVFLKREITSVISYTIDKTYDVAADTQIATCIGSSVDKIFETSGLGEALRDEIGDDSFQDGNDMVDVSYDGSLNVVYAIIRGKDIDQVQKVYTAFKKVFPKYLCSIEGSLYASVLSEIPPTAEGQLPSKLISSLIGGCIGFVLFLIIAMIKTLFFRKIKRKEDVETVTSMQCLGSLPEVRTPRGKGVQLLDINSTKPRMKYYSHAIRSISFKLDKDLQRLGKKILLIASIHPNEGKSSVTVNLARSLKNRGKKVLIIDFNYQNPTIEKSLGIQRAKTGLEHVYFNESPVLSAICEHMDIHTLSFLTSNNDFSKYVQSEETANLLNQLKEKFDYILIDTAPVSVNPDYLKLNEYADCQIFVIRKEFDRKSNLQNLVNGITGKSANVLGYIMNGVSEKELSISYGYGYHYGSQYGYGSRSKRESRRTGKH